MSRPLEVRMAVAEERLDNVEEEQLRQRMRLHDLEADRATLNFVVRQIAELTTSIERIAKQAAVEAIDLAMEHRDALGNRRWTLRLQWMGVGIASGGLVATIIALISQGG